MPHPSFEMIIVAFPCSLVDDKFGQEQNPEKYCCIKYIFNLFSVVYQNAGLMKGKFEILRRKMFLLTYV